MMIVKNCKTVFHSTGQAEHCRGPGMGNVVDEEVSAAFCNSAVCKRYIVVS